MLVYLDLIEDQSDRDKFILLYNTYSGLMYHTAYNILKNDQDAEDAVHQAFLNVIELLPKIRTVYSRETKALMMMLAKRRAIDAVRKRSRFVDMEIDDTIAGTDITDRLSGGLAEALGRLNPRYSRAILLWYGYGYNTKEVAKLMGITLDAARKLLTRAKNALRDELEKENEDEE